MLYIYKYYKFYGQTKLIFIYFMMKKVENVLRGFKFVQTPPPSPDIHNLRLDIVLDFKLLVCK